MKNLILSLLLGWAIFASPSQAAILKFEKGLGWYYFQNQTSSQFNQKFHEYSNKGYMVIDFDARPIGSSARYSMILRKNTDNRGWNLYYNLTSSEFSQRWNEMSGKGYRLLDQESYTINGVQRYAGVWVQNKEGYLWASYRNKTAAEYSTIFQDKKSEGYRITDIEAYNVNGNIRYAAIWVKNTEGIVWAQQRDMSRTTYVAEAQTKISQGYVMVDYESYQIDGVQKYAAIWEKRSGYAYHSKTNLTALEFANRSREYRDKGFRLVDYEQYATSDGTRYGGIWLENSSRYHYSKKNQLNNLVSSFQQINNLPGISVAIMRNGTMLYQRGFGFADKESGKVAHSESIYLGASVSKVICGTIATKLHDEGQLHNGTPINFNLNNATSTYLTNVKKSDNSLVTLPGIHFHTVAELFAHLGCIPHYSTGPEPNIQHYNKAIDALTQIWNSKLSSCLTGISRNYSTHAFTYIAAVLEQVTGKRSADLVRSELAIPYGLPSMRAMYTNSTIPFNYERVRPYNDSNNPTSISNNSWKVWGGGIEASPADLVRFGWKVLNGTIVNANARDNILWKNVGPSPNGIAWRLGVVNGRQIAEHSGRTTGTHAHLRVYRNDGLVIAIMTNRKIDALTPLMDNLAEEVLAPGRLTLVTTRARSTDQNLDQLNKQIVTYPNPVSDIVTLQAPGIKIKEVQVQNLLGKAYKVALKNNQISLKSLPPGLYILTIDTDQGKVTKKVIKK
ncbi:hypothetical protein BKI52_40815 [marine bacterium AO1-C]|nr:hypothetical protein BKI52_40815 [marine bacterium AO1-C]